MTSIVLLCAALLVAVEALSAYFLYRYYAQQQKPFQPMGSSTSVLSTLAVDKLRGVRHQVKVTVDPMPLFVTSKVLGFTISPGHHRVVENFKIWYHQFDLTVTPEGRRATSYRPVHAARRLIVTGDSAIFGWGIDDEETLAWLLQGRLPDFEVVNLSLTSYSTVHALLQLRALAPALGPTDTLVLLYHPVTNDFNVAAPGVLRQLSMGYEVQAGDTASLLHMDVPFASVDAGGALAIHRVDLACVDHPSVAGCEHPAVAEDVARKVTQRVFDDILALGAGKVVLAFISGRDDDSVVAYLRSRGVTIADLRPPGGQTLEPDVIPTDLHAGPFWHHQFYVRFLQALVREKLVE